MIYFKWFISNSEGQTLALGNGGSAKVKSWLGTFMGKAEGLGNKEVDVVVGGYT